MSVYRAVHVRFWNDEKTVDLSPLERLAWLYLLTGPQTNSFGLYVACPKTMGIESGIGTRTFNKAFKKAIDRGFAEYDIAVRLVYIPKFVDYNPPRSINALKAWGKKATELPRSPLYAKAYAIVEAIVDDKTEAFKQAFYDGWPKP